MVYTFTDPSPDSNHGDEKVVGSTIKVEYEVKEEKEGTPLAEFVGSKLEPDSPTTDGPLADGLVGDTLVELDSGDGVKEEIPEIGEEGVLDILDQVDGTKEIGSAD